MKRRTYMAEDAERLRPLLRSIRRELRERTLAVTHFEERLEAFTDTRHVHRDDVARLESELSTHRRELRRLEREIKELGLELDEDRPLRILIPTGQGALACEGELLSTTIRLLPLKTQR